MAMGIKKAIATFFMSTALLPLGFSTAAQAEVVTLEFDYETPDHSGTITSQGVTVNLSYAEQTNPEGWSNYIPTLTIQADEQEVLRLTEDSSFMMYSLVQIAEMDSNNNFPEVIFSQYSGGAHCCAMVKIFTQDPDSNTWEVVDVGAFDGGPIPVEDPDDNGIYEYVTSDNRFLYRYSSYAGSFPPVQVWQLDGLTLQDVSQEQRFHPLHQERLQAMWASIQNAETEGYEVNGMLAGYVATKAVLGETQAGWNLMLNRYDRTSDWGLEECRGNFDDQGNCEGGLLTYDSFPAALEAFLEEANYLTAPL
ncbi:hypothetical protein [Picosynechococcus sp. PCC 7003]|uniref:hypothetical protein n=1 Tax=Picosynechococcus sp. PCC 7003 TaxID=374981 RepID=UPI000A03E0A1|nr:hypothetical protein [Picosynechococcus sp. PCC 7003]